MPSRDWTRQEIIDETIRQADAANADAAIVLAVFDQETGGTFDERSVGDGGNSFGLRQLNRFGQLYGHSAEWAFDPANAIPDAIRALGKAKTPAQATNVQNPYDKAGYTKSLAARVAKWRKALAGRSATAAPGGKIVEVIGPLDGPQADHMDHVHVAGEGTENDPTIAWVTKRAKSHGLRVSSNERTPAENDDAGGSTTSRHLTTDKTHWARDYAGSMNAMTAFNQEMRGAQGSSPTGSSSTSPTSDDSELVRTGVGIPGIDLPSKEDVVQVVVVLLLLVLGLALFALGVAVTFKDTAAGEVAVAAATKGKAK